MTSLLARVRTEPEPGLARRLTISPTAALGLLAGLGFLAAVVVEANEDYVFLLRLAVAGLGAGAVAALSGLGLVLTYRATGVFNFAQGAIATFVAFVLWQLATQWGVPLYLAAAIAVLFVGPALGVLAEGVVFRPLQRRAASTSEKLVATLGIFVLLIGVSTLLFGLGTKTDAPSLFGDTAFKPFGGGFVFSETTVGELAILVVVAGGVTAMLRYTKLGGQIRAVVDKRQLSELAGINANRVAAISWAMGCGFAGLVGVLYAPGALNTYGLTLLVLDTFGVAAIARLTSLPLAVVGGLLLGIVQSLSTVLPLPPPYNVIQPNLLALALPVFLLLHRDLDEIGDVGNSARGIVSSAVGSVARLRQRVAAGGTVFAIAVIVPLVLSGSALDDAQTVLALTVVFLSIVAITGFSGHITLGQAGFAGLGAYFTTKIVGGNMPGFPDMPLIAAMILGALMVVPLGIATGYPALRRRGLILGLATLAVGLLVYQLVFNNVELTGGLANVPRPELFGLSLDGDRAFYWFELVWLGLMLLLARNLRSGRLGRVLAAMRDSENGARSIGISLRQYKLFIFAASSFMAAIGGALIAEQARTFTVESYSPLISLFWFTAVVVGGLSYLSGAAVAAIIYVVIGAAVGQSNASIFVIGLLALFIGRLPGGLAGTFARWWRAATSPPPRPTVAAAPAARPVAARPAAARRVAQHRAPARPEPAPVPSALARRLLDEARR